MRKILKNIGGVLARNSDEHPWWILGAVLVITIVAVVLAQGLEMNTNVVDMLPTQSPTVQSYIEVINEFGEANTIIALEGERDRMVEAAEYLIPRLDSLDLIYNVQGTIPLDYFIDHGLMLVDEVDLDRTLERFSDPTLVGFLRGINDDFEREYTDNEENLRDDEVDLAQAMHGFQRSLEIMATRLAGEDYVSVDEAVDAMLVGDPWALSLDREMMLIMCTPTYSILEINPLLEMAEQVHEVLAEARPHFPDVYIGLTGNGPLQKDEMDAITTASVVLFLVALVLIYILLSRNFGGWVLPLIALTSLLVGIIWTAGFLAVTYGSLNLFTAMFAVILLGLGIDFAIHLITRFYEERGRGRDIRDSLAYMIGGTGVAVLTGGLTTAAAFLALLVGETKGISQLGVTIGGGIALTLAAVFLTIPSLLVLLSRRQTRLAAHYNTITDYSVIRAHTGWRGSILLIPNRILRAAGFLAPFRRLHFKVVKKRIEGVPGSREGWHSIGRIAALSWRRWGLFLALLVLIAGVSLWAGLRNEYELDWMNLEPKGLENVRLQREIPERFGSMTEGAWIVVGSIEEARDLKERLEGLSMVGEVSSISDLLPTADRVESYAPRLETFRRRIENTRTPHVGAGWSGEELAIEVERLWDNLDLMSNLAFAGGLDRAVKSLDRLTGYDNETNSTDQSAVLPTLVRLLESGVDPTTGAYFERAWYEKMRENLIRMSNTEPVGIEDLPETVRKTMLPRDGSEKYLVNITAKDYLWHQTNLRRFAEQMEEADPDISGTSRMMLDFLDLIGKDGLNGMIVAFAIILVLLLVTFRGPLGLLAMIPLVGGGLIMLGIMALLGMKYNFMNFMAIPVILGIGIDDGVHALHRFQEESAGDGDRVYNTFRFVGRAILLTTITTMIGFGSLGFQLHVAMASFGIVLMMGVGACFITTVVFLPAVMRLLGGNNFKSVPISNGAPLATTLLLAFGVAAAFPSPARAQETAGEWMERIADAEQVEHSYGVMKQTITTSTGAERTFTIRAWSSQDGEVGLMAYVAPARVAGDRILTLNSGDDIWYYMKRRDTTRHFVGHTRKQSAMGSDFSYEDMASGDFTEDYTGELLGYEEMESVQCVKLKCTPTPSGPSYDYIILWAGKEDALTRRVEYYEEGEHLKTLYISDFREIEGRTVAMRVEMVSEQKDSRTVMETEEITFAEAPDPSIFTQAALTRPLPPQREEGGER